MTDIKTDINCYHEWYTSEVFDDLDDIWRTAANLPLKGRIRYADKCIKCHAERTRTYVVQQVEHTTPYEIKA